jgi:hypothetical protein
MYFVFEISRPFQKRINFYRCPGVTTFSIVWLWFRIALHPMREDEMIERAASRQYAWHERATGEKPWRPSCS